VCNGYRVGREWVIVCREQILLGELDRGWGGKGVGELCVDGRLC